MNLSIKDFLNNNTIKKDFSYILKEDDVFPNDDEIVFLQGSFTFEVSLLENIINLNGFLKADLELFCSRCSEKFQKHLEIPIIEEYGINSDFLENSDDDIDIIEGDNLDITNIVESNILFELPYKKLCNENCKGLCQECGKNLNFEECNCEIQEIDPRLSVLKNFFK